MLSRHKRLLTAGLVIVLATAVALRLRHRASGTAPTADEPTSEVQRDRWRGFEMGHDVPRPPTDAGHAVADPGSREVTPEQVSTAMADWRDAILNKRAEQVMRLDQAFSFLPGRYGPELVKMAEHDPEARVRAFCVRVLGKMRNTALVGDFQRMLTNDKSPFVRQNAAWALGELARRPGGKEAALAALDELHQAEDDPATEVRAAATNALKALQ